MTDTRGRWALGAMLGMACGSPPTSEPPDGTTGPGSTTAAMASTAGADDSTTGIVLPDLGAGTPHQTVTCADYVACAQALGLDDAAAIEQMYGGQGPCWDTFEQAAECNATCEQELAAIVMQLEADGEPVPAACDPPQIITWGEIAAMIGQDCVAGCHEPGGLDSSLDLSGDPYLALYQVNSDQSLLYLVDPGSAADSYLWHKLRGSQGSVGGMGSRMPRDAEPWPAEVIDAIEAWIDAGASNL